MIHSDSVAELIDSETDSVLIDFPDSQGHCSKAQRRQMVEEMVKVRK